MAFLSYGWGRDAGSRFLTSSTLPPGDRDEVVPAMKDVSGLTVARHLRGEVYEVRASGARAAYRVLFASEGAKSQVLLAVSAFTKKTQRTPPAEIRLASVASPIGGDEGIRRQPITGFWCEGFREARWPARMTSTS